MSAGSMPVASTRRAFGPGARRAFAGAAVLAAAALAGCGGAKGHQAISDKDTAALAAAHQKVVAALAGAKKNTAAYGGVPSYIPKARVPVDRVLSASTSHHVLASQGNTVALTLPGGRASITAVGPHVPSSVIGTQATKTTARFDVVVTGSHGAVSLAPALFSITDQLGHVHRPSVKLASGGTAPARVRAGQRVALSLGSILPEGTGLLRYGPTPARSLIGWDFTVETD